MAGATLDELDASSGIENTDLFLTRKGTVEKKATGEQVANFIKEGVLNNALTNLLPYNARYTSLTDCNNAPIGLYGNNKVSNAPNDTAAHILLLTIAFDNNTSYEYQMCFCISNNNIFTRVKINGVWGSWSTK